MYISYVIYIVYICRYVHTYKNILESFFFFRKENRSEKLSKEEMICWSDTRVDLKIYKRQNRVRNFGRGCYDGPTGEFNV